MTSPRDCRLPRRRYDPADYAEEWVFLTRMRMRSDQIIERSAPSREWFSRHVKPLVSISLCSVCGVAFNPQETGMLMRCAQNCGAGNRKVLRLL